MITATVTLFIWVKFRKFFYRHCTSKYHRNIFMVLIILSLVMILCFYFHLRVGVRRSGSFIIDRGGCLIADFDPWNLEVAHFLKTSEPPKCNNGVPPLVRINFRRVFIDMDAIPHYVKSNGHFYCCYKSFVLFPPTFPGRRGRKTFSSNCIHFIDSLIEHDYISVYCFVNDVNVFTEHFALIQTKPKVETRCEKITSRKQSSDFNVLILGFEGMSRNHLYRVMPRTVEWLRNMSAVDFAGMNVVGLHAVDNIMPILMGLTSSEEKGFWSNPEKLNKFPWIYSDFNKAGFRTVHGDNSAESSIFKKKKASYQNNHIDYFFQSTFVLKIDDDKREYPTKKYCIGSRTHSQILIDYMDDFITEMITKQFFGFFWDAHLTFYDFNIHPGYDSLYVKFLQKHIQLGLFNRTILIFLSDRGYYGSGVKDTFQGLHEQHNPFLFVVLPEDFKKKYSLATKHIYKNTQKLITAFDIHETLKDILYHEKLLQNDVYVNRTQEIKEHNSYRRGISLFLPVPENRHCMSIGIDANLCLCMNVVPLEITKGVAKHVIYPVLHELLKLLSKYPQCAILNLDQLYFSQVHKEDMSSLEQLIKRFSSNVNDKKLRKTHHRIIMKTKPGNALFEVSFMYSGPQNSSESFQLIDSVKRINSYGNESYCIDDVNLKPICHCRKSGGFTNK